MAQNGSVGARASAAGHPDFQEVRECWEELWKHIQGGVRMPEGFVPPPETKQFWDALREQLEDMADECWQDLEGSGMGSRFQTGPGKP